MAIDHIINHPCAAKQELGAGAIIHLVKSRLRAEMLLERFMKEGMGREEAMQATFGVQVRRPSGEEEMKRVSIAQLMREAELLIDHEPQCLNCPVSFGRKFGCYQSVNFPISEKAEEWLAKMAANAVSKGMPDSILIKFMLDQGVTGQSFKSLRGGEQFRYMESDYAYELEIEDPALGNAVIDTDQILEMFFAIGEMKDVHQQFVLFFSGGLSVQDTPPAQERIGVQLQSALLKDQRGQVKFWVYRMPDELSDDISIRQIKAYLRAMFAAFSVQATFTADF